MRGRMGERTGSDWLTTRRRYRRLAFGVLFAGVLAFVAGDIAGYPIGALALYWLGFVGFLGVQKWAPMALFDERECRIERQASYDAVRVIAIVLIGLAPATGTLEAVGEFETPALIEGALWGYVGLFALFGVAYLWRRHRS
jgi:uncharacterized membrane protein